MSVANDKNILITGGCGLVGSHLADRLLEAGARRVTLLDNYVRGHPLNVAHLKGDPRVEIVEGDLTDRELVDRLMRGKDYLFHQAALRITYCAERPAECLDSMVTAVYWMLDSARRNGVKKVVAASSVSIYGEPPRLPIEEDFPLNNDTLYGAAKIALEQFLRAFRAMHGMPYAALRYFNIYGPRMDIWSGHTEVLVRWVRALRKGVSPIVHGTGEQSMDFIYVSDVVDANLLALESGAESEAFNVGTGEATSLKDLLEILCDVLETDVRPRYEPQRAVGSIQKRQADVRKAEAALGFKARVNLKDGLRRLVEWMRQVEPDSSRPVGKPLTAG